MWQVCAQQHASCIKTNKQMTMYRLLLFVSIVCTSAVSAQNAMTITPGTTFKTTGGVVITLQDMNLVTDASVIQLPGEGVFRFTGSGNNTISGASIPLLNQVELAKTAGARLTLQQTVRVGTSLTFNGGLFDIGTAQVQLEPAALLLNESESSRITTSGNGTVRITTTLNAPSAANPGNLGLSITSLQNLGSVTIARGHSAINLSSVGRPSINRVFEVVPANNSGLNANLRVFYFDAELNGRTENQLSLWRSTDNTSWTGTGFSGRDGTANWVQLNGLAAITRWWTATDINFPTNVFDLLPDSKPHLLWPNPATAQQPVNLRFSVKKRTEATVRVTDIQGRTLYLQSLQLEKGVNNLSFSVGSWANGMYQVLVLGEDGSKLTSSFVKQ